MCCISFDQREQPGKESQDLGWEKDKTLIAHRTPLDIHVYIYIYWDDVAVTHGCQTISNEGAIVPTRPKFNSLYQEEDGQTYRDSSINTN